jgi:hypothetical protein
MGGLRGMTLHQTLALSLLATKKIILLCLFWKRS